MAPRPYWAIECLDREEAELLLESSPHGSYIEVIPKQRGDLVILWVPVPDDVIRAALGHNPWRPDAAGRGTG